MLLHIHALREKKEIDALKTRFFKSCFFKGLSQTEQEKVLWINFNQISSVITCVCMLASLAGYGERGEVVEIQWYPGHMARAKRELREILPLLDLIIEVTDARLPFSGRNPELSALLGKKPRILLLNKADLADPEVTAAWVKQYRSQGEAVLEFNARRGENLSQLENLIKREGEKILKQKPTLRLGVVGVPNCGKSSVLNRFVRRSAARVGEKPGVTRGRQWVKRGKWEILDTPGLLWPKIENRETGLKMALIGLIKPDLLDIEGWFFIFSSGWRSIIQRRCGRRTLWGKKMI